jgi:hypothetical protein
MKRVKFPISVLFIVLTAMGLSGCERSPILTAQQLVDAYPNVGPNSSRAENTDILCPFLRLIERSGLFDDQDDLVIPAADVADAARIFGCSKTNCQTIATATGTAQAGFGGVDLEALHAAFGISHECGLTYEFNGTSVSDEVRTNTLDRLAELADENGHLVYQDLETVKLEICDAQGVGSTLIGMGEVQLIYAYLGGSDNGYIQHSDVVRFLTA